MLLMDKRKRFRVPEPPGHAGEFAWALFDALKWAGGYRALQRFLFELGEKISVTHMNNLREGVAESDIRIANALVSARPDIAARMYEAMGVVVTGQETGLEDDVNRIAEERGIPAVEVLSTLVNEELRRMSK